MVSKHKIRLPAARQADFWSQRAAAAPERPYKYTIVNRRLHSVTNKENSKCLQANIWRLTSGNMGARGREYGRLRAKI